MWRRAQVRQRGHVFGTKAEIRQSYFFSFRAATEIIEVADGQDR